MKYYAIIVAGGSGSRMQSGIPKQFLLLNGRPVLMHTVDAFYNSDLRPEIIIVLNPQYFRYWEELCLKYSFKTPYTLVKGGHERFGSVKNGLQAVSGPSVIAVHDAVRPLISNELITRSFIEAREKGSAIAAVPSKDSVRIMQNGSSASLKRGDIMLIQTPQTFRSELLEEAYELPYSPEFTDDASVLDKMGIKLNIIRGDQNNIKITFPDDIKIAELLMKGAIAP